MNSLKTFRRTLISVLFVVLTCSVILFVGSCDVVLTPDEGKTGKSAYDIWLDNGYEGSETDFLEWLRGLGTRGEKGDTGAQGEQGIQGEKGPDSTTEGRTAYQAAVLNGFGGTLTEWLDSLVGGGHSSDVVGPKGEDGVFDRTTVFNDLKTNNKTVLGSIDELVTTLEDNRLKLIELLSSPATTSDSLVDIANRLNEIKKILQNKISEVNIL